MIKIRLACTLFTIAVAGRATAESNAPVDSLLGRGIPSFTAEAIVTSADPPKRSPFDSSKAQHVTAYIFIGTTCPATSAYVERFKQLEQTYAPKGVDFVYIYPNSNDTSDAKLAFHKDKKFAGPMIDDQGAQLAKLFRAQRTSELYVGDTKGTIVYHGAVDDSRDPGSVKQHYLAAALDELLAGKPITVASSQVFA